MHGTYLASDDLTSVLANYQAFAAKMENLDMLVGGCVSIEQLMESVAQGKTADDNVLLRSAFDRGICVAAPFQDESAQHFRCVVYEPCHKTVYILDSLNVRSFFLFFLFWGGFRLQTTSAAFEDNGHVQNHTTWSTAILCSRHSEAQHGWAVEYTISSWPGGTRNDKRTR